MKLQKRILDLLRSTNSGLTDREITDSLIGKGKPQQCINALMRNLAKNGKVERRGEESPIKNYPIKKHENRFRKQPPNNKCLLVKESPENLGDIRIVIQCCKTKNQNSILLCNNRRVVFQPQSNLPWCNIDNTNTSWVEALRQQNGTRPNLNYSRLLPAGELYLSNVHRGLLNWVKEGRGRELYILSAGWGLVCYKRKMPNYDITFSGGQQNNYYINPQEIPYDRLYNDLQGLDSKKATHIFVCRSYAVGAQYFFKNKEAIVEHRRTSSSRRLLETGNTADHNITIRTNWHYKAVREFIGEQYFND